MKSLAELETIRQRTLEKVAMRKEGDDAVRVVVGMATCGIAAGARPVMLKFLEEVQQAQPAERDRLPDRAASACAVWSPSLERHHARQGKGDLRA